MKLRIKNYKKIKIILIFILIIKQINYKLNKKNKIYKMAINFLTKINLI